MMTEGSALAKSGGRQRSGRDGAYGVGYGVATFVSGLHIDRYVARDVLDKTDPTSRIWLPFQAKRDDYPPGG